MSGVRGVLSACVLTVVFLCLAAAATAADRHRLVDAVDRYFRAGHEVRIEMSDGDPLRRYWRQWVDHVGSLQRDTAWPPERPLAREALDYWKQMARAAGNMQAAQRLLTGRFGVSLLRGYACHRKPERVSC